MYEPSPRVKAIAAVIGGFLVHFTLGTVYTFGNINPYLTSYLRMYSNSPDTNFSQSVWIFAMCICGQGCTMSIGGIIERHLGPRWTTLLGSAIMSLGVLLTAWTVKVHIVLVVFTLGIMFGVGTGIAYAVAIASAMAWFPKRKGLVGGLVVAGFGGGAFVFDQVQTRFINPKNLKLNKTSEKTASYFTDPDLLSKVPSCFLLTGFIYAILQLIGSLMITKPGPYDLTGEDQQLTKSMEKDPDAISETSEMKAQDEKTNDKYETGISPVNMIRQRDFWILWATFLFNSVPIVFISSLYKAYGEEYVQDDTYLAVVGSIAALCNAGGRVMWGQLIDFVPYKWLMFFQTGIMAVALFTFHISTQTDEAMYLIWVLILFTDLSANFALFPATCSKLFGQLHMATNYGVLFTGNALAGVLGAIISTSLMNFVGWTGIFVIGGVSAVISFILTFFYQDKVVTPGF